MKIYKIEKIENEFIQVDYFGMIDNKVICTGFVEYGKDYKLLYSLFTDKDYRNKGYGTIMINHIINEVNDDLWLDVFKSNTGGIKLYERLGFTKQHDKNDEIIWMLRKNEKNN